MKTKQLVLVLGTVAALGGCASAEYYVVADTERMDRLERLARANNTQVIWVNAPTRRSQVLEGETTTK